MRYLTTCLLFLSLSTLQAVEKPATEAKLDTKNQESTSFSYAIGYHFANTLAKEDLVNMNEVMQGFKARLDGSQTLSETEIFKLISDFEETNFNHLCEKNLAFAEDFLQKNRALSGITLLEEGKIQYKVDRPGEGDGLASYHTPLVRYVGKYSDGTVFGSSEEEPELIELDQTIEGLKKGVLGMKEGEKRTIYIHPECAFGKAGPLQPNSLLTFEVELVKLNAKGALPEEVQDKLITSSQEPDLALSK